MKSPSTDLHQLIKSLTKHDIIYFKLQLRKRGIEGLVVDLFDIIRTQDVYDEAAAKAKLEKHYSVRNFPSHKMRLYDQILESLRIRRAGNSQQEAVDRQLSNAECLIELGLLGQAAKTLVHAAKMAREIDYHTALIEILEKQRRILQKRQPPGIVKAMNASLDESQKVLQEYQLVRQYQTLHDRMLLHSSQSYKQPSAESKAALQELLKSPLLQNESLAVTFDCRRYYYAIMARYHRLHNRHEETTRFRRKIVELWESNPERLSDGFMGFSKSLANYANSCMLCDPIDTKTINEVVAKIHNLKPQNFAQDVEKFQNEAHLLLLNALNSCELEPVLTRLEWIESGLRKFGDHMVQSRLLTIFYNLAVIHFILEDYQTSLQWLLRIMNDFKTDARKDIQMIAQVVFAIVHVELDSEDSLDMLIRRILASLKRNKKSVEYEKVIVDELKLLSKAVSEAEKFTVYERLCFNIRAIAAGPRDQHFLGMRELLFWLESIVQNRPTLEVFVEYNAKRGA